MLDDRLPADALETIAARVHDVVTRQHTDPGDDLFTWTRDYGAFGDVHLVVPPGPPGEWDVDAVRVTAERGTTYDVLVGMWTEEEGRSDLSLDVELRLEATGWTAIARDLHVR